MIALSLIFSLQGFVQAHERGLNPERHHHHHKHENWKQKELETEQKILGWVNQYTPDKKEEWTKVIAEKKRLRSQWMSEKNKEKREQWKKAKKDEFNKLITQLDEGKITKDEFIKKLHGEKRSVFWTTYRELEEAINNKNNAQVIKHLDQLLTLQKEHNKKIEKQLK